MSELDRLNAALAGRYRLEHELGAGGMATVYLAQDLRHDRKVALKLLRPELAAVIGGERFLQEIRVTANLQHPHILPLFDSGHEEGLLYYVMPYVQGESLRDKLNRDRQLPIKEAVEIATAVAGALDYAHRHEVIHRDIKPENILLHDGQALVADFGIALAIHAAGGVRLTETGLSLGTPHYMSPEQATGDRQLDAKSDIYSLGCVLYEMLGGDPPYTGSTAQAIIAKVITEKPRPIASLRETVPPHVAATVHKALAKLPADRFATAAEFIEGLTTPGLVAASRTATTPESAATVATRVRPKVVVDRRVALIAPLAALGLGALGGWLLGPVAEIPVNPVRFAVRPAADQVFSNTTGADVAFSPDGSRFVYRGQGQVGAQLFARAVDELEIRPIPGTEGASQPFFSPDGLWLGFFAEGQLRKVQATGGPPLPITDVTGGLRGATWGSNDIIVFGSDASRGLMQVAAAGGVATPLTTPDSTVGETAHRWPAFGPRGKTVFFTSWSGSNESARIAVASLESGTVIRSAEAGVNPHYTRSGHLVYARSDFSVVGVPFDIGKLEVTGQAFPLLANVQLGSGGVADLAISSTGSMVYVPSSSSNVSLVLVDRDGNETPLDERRRGFRSPRFSPSGDRVVVDIDGQAWVYDLQQGTLSLQTFGSAINYPTWSPDGMHLLFAGSGRTPQLSLLRVPADGRTREPEVVFESGADIFEGAISPDGKWLAFRQTGVDGSRDIMVAPLEGADRTPRPIAQTEFQERALAISPNGRWLAYHSDESGRDEVYVRAFPAPGALVQVSTDGGRNARWSPDGTELYYRTGTEMVAAAVDTEGPMFRVTGRTALFDDNYVQSNPDYAFYDVDPVSGRFLMVKGDGTREIVVVANWVEGLRRRRGGQ